MDEKASASGVDQPVLQPSLLFEETGHRRSVACVKLGFFGHRGPIYQLSKKRLDKVQEIS